MHPLRLGVLIIALLGAFVPVFHVFFLYFSYDALQNRLSALANSKKLPSPIPCLHSDTYSRVAHIERLSQYYSWTVLDPGAIVPNNQTLIAENFKVNGIPRPTNGMTVAFCVIVFGWYLFMAFLVPTVNPIGSKVDLPDSDTLETDSTKKPKFQLEILKGPGLLRTIAALHTMFTFGNVVLGVLAFVSTRDGFFTLETPTIIDDPTARNLDIGFLVQEIIYLFIGLTFSVLIWNYIFLAQRRPTSILKYNKGKYKGSQSIDSVSDKPVTDTTGSQAAITNVPFTITEQLQIRNDPKHTFSQPSFSVEPSKVSMEITDNEYSNLLEPNTVVTGPTYNPTSMIFPLSPQQAYASSMYQQTSVQQHQSLPQQNFQPQIKSPPATLQPQPVPIRISDPPKRISDLIVESLEQKIEPTIVNHEPKGRIQVSTTQIPKMSGQKSLGTISPDIDEVFAMTAETDYPYAPF
ncbi:hypothetical protein HK096_011541, partial [Nowakowskiella sp. JEL0078]